VNHADHGTLTATVSDTRAAILERSRRNATPIRKLFVQTPRSLAQDPRDLSGPLSTFVKHRDRRGLDAYLLLLAATSSGDGQDGWSTTHPLGVLARAIGTTTTASGTSANTAASKILTRLVDRQLIRRERSGRARMVRVTLLREDAGGHSNGGEPVPYTRPDGKSLPNRFFSLHHDFWLEGWCDRMTLAGVAMLLVALHETGRTKPTFRLPTHRVPEWYGWSADTAERGLRELQDQGLLSGQRIWRPEPLSATGVGSFNEYALLSPFSTSTARATEPNASADEMTGESK
jgi:hypothetical protein